MTSAPDPYKFDGFDPGKLGKEWWRPHKLLQSTLNRFGLAIMVGLIALIIESPLKAWIDTHFLGHINARIAREATDDAVRTALNRATTSAHETRALTDDTKFYPFAKGDDIDAYFTDGNQMGELTDLEEDLHFGPPFDDPSPPRLEKGTRFTPFLFKDRTWAEPTPGYALIRLADGTYGMVKTRAVERATLVPAVH